MRAARYRVWQMWRSLAVRRLGDEDRAILESLQRNPDAETYVVNLMRKNRGIFGVRI